MPIIDSVQATQLYRDNQSLLRARSWQHARAYKLPFEDFMSEAHLIFCNALMTYDPSRGASFTTYLYNRLDALSHLATNQEKPWQERTRSDTWLCDHIPTSSSEFAVTGWDSVLPSASARASVIAYELKDYEAAMTADARQLYDWQQFGDLNPPETAKAKIKPLTAWSVFQRKAKQSGWTWQRTQQAWNNLRMVLDNYRFARDLEPVE